ncbi:PAP2-domain-containing protein [Ramaria rubella]|nr:PAP2-domain-containing protein [Ramaria rubella]
MSRMRPAKALNILLSTIVNAVSNLETSLSPSLTISRLRAHSFIFSDIVYVFHLISAIFWLTIMQQPSFPTKLLIPILYTIALLIPLTSQFFVPATPIFSWLITYYTSRFIPAAYRPTISVSLLPTLESVLYGANISDILTRFTHPVLDIIAWLPYGVIHFIAPFVVAASLWLFAPKPALRFWANLFGYMSITGVWCQILFPCSAPWYELIYGLTPADYSMPGSPGGLARIDGLFHSKGYTTAFSGAPVVFGAFPSLHAGYATIEALVVSHFFPALTPYVWAYTGVLYWATMYLTHHYLVDVVGGGCLATAFFYLFLPAELDVRPSSSTVKRNKHELYDLEVPTLHRRVSAFSMSSSLDSQDEDDQDIAYRSPTVPHSAVPFLPQVGGSGGANGAPRRSHKHTASIASLIRAEERVEDGWSPIGGGFVLPPTPTSAATPWERERERRPTIIPQPSEGGGGVGVADGIPRSRSPNPHSSREPA